MNPTKPYKWFDYLPHDLRRRCYRTLAHDTYWSLIELRRNNPQSTYSLNGFNDRKCIFVHIPKCAGVSINKTLFNSLGGGHNSAMDYQIIYGRNVFKSYFKFTFSRNPWDRVFSAYNFLKKGGFDEIDKEWAETNLKEFDTFDKFVCEWINTDNINTKNHFVPQHKYICNPRGKVIIDFIGRFENISSDFKKITGTLGIDLPLKHDNKTDTLKNNRYTEHYTTRSEKIISEVYKEDINLLGYRFNHDEQQ